MPAFVLGVQTIMRDDENSPRGLLQGAAGQITLLVLAAIVLLIFAWSYVR
jgi:hypothetical protein